MTRIRVKRVRHSKISWFRRSEVQVLKRLILSISTAVILILLLLNWHGNEGLILEPNTKSKLPPLMMKGGDPYIRALMRTISASESNFAQPYSVIYGGDRVSDLSRHPNLCVKIVSGPNKGDCTTAAGRYQFLSSTWEEKAKKYHPEPTQFLFWKEYSFAPEFQDAVVYAWLSDRKFWKADISQLLKQGKFNQVQRLLSGTWTSFGYGIENNSMTGDLPEIYAEILQEELQKASQKR
ncbi:glycoside hydrolase [Oscillatoriales cyanobacterium USR001]|nr:glycoside hydrolase [Oscillatoriales cyanobacterium USR001]